jgi:site-specific DNA recombinase
MAKVNLCHTSGMATDALVYVRISRDREGAGLGVERQEGDCRALADRLGWNVLGVYVDNDMSAYSGKPRPGYRRMLADLDTGMYGGVLAWHTDRLYRMPPELEELGALCDKRTIPIQTVKAGLIDLSTSAGWLNARMLGAVARYEVDHMIERIEAAKLQAAAAGKWGGGPRPFGYAADGVTVDESEAAVVRAVADLVLAGSSLRSLTADLNARGVRTSTGRQWAPTELKKMLVRPRNAGLRQHRGQVIGPAAWPAILEEDTWRALCAQVGDPGRRTSPPPGRVWLGSGLFLCGVCADGQTVSAGTSSTGSGGHKPGYRCRSRRHVTRDAVAVDEFVTAVVVGRLSRPDAAGLLRVGEPPDMAALHTEALALRAQLDELGRMYGARQMDARQVAEASAILHADLADVEDRIGRAASRSVLAGVAGVRDPAEVWAGLSLDRRRAVVDALLTVTILPTRRGRLPGGGYFDPDAIRIDWKV